MGAVHKGFTIFTLILSAQSYPATAPKRRATVRIYFYDYAGVSRGALKQAEAVITRVLDEAGIGVSILQCSASAEPHTPPDCLKALDAAELVVRIIPGDRRDRERKLGISVGTSMATISYQRALAYAAEQPPSQRVPIGQILGYGAVHEIGHLLLPSGHHSPTGVMRAEWSVEELKSIRAGSLRFTPEQAAGMREEVMRRTKETRLGSLRDNLP